MTIDAEKRLPDSEDVPSPPEGRTGSLVIGTVDDIQVLDKLGYKPELSRNRSMFTLLFQSLAIAAIPYVRLPRIPNCVAGMQWLLVYHENADQNLPLLGRGRTHTECYIWRWSSFNLCRLAGGIGAG